MPHSLHLTSFFGDDCEMQSSSYASHKHIKYLSMSKDESGFCIAHSRKTDGAARLLFLIRLATHKLQYIHIYTYRKRVAGKRNFVYLFANEICVCVLGNVFERERESCVVCVQSIIIFYMNTKTLSLLTRRIYKLQIYIRKPNSKHIRGPIRGAQSKHQSSRAPTHHPQTTHHSFAPINAIQRALYIDRAPISQFSFFHVHLSLGVFFSQRTHAQKYLPLDLIPCCALLTLPPHSPTLRRRSHHTSDIFLFIRAHNGRKRENMLPLNHIYIYKCIHCAVVHVQKDIYIYITKKKCLDLGIHI